MTTDMLKASKGNRKALLALFDENKQHISFLCKAFLRKEEDAADVAASSLRAALQAALDGKLESEEAFSDFAVQKVIDGCKAQLFGKNQLVLKPDTEGGFSVGKPENSKISKNGGKLETLLPLLPDGLRFLFVLRRGLDCDAAKAAEISGLDEETVAAAYAAEKENLAFLQGVVRRAGGNALPATEEWIVEAFREGIEGCAVPKNAEEQAQKLIDSAAAPLEQKNKKRLRTIAICAAAALFLLAGIYVLNNPPAKKGTAPLPDGVNASYIADIKIKDYGTITVALDATAAPKTVENFVKLVKSGFYDGLTFHRIMQGFMMQGGDPTATGSGGSGENIVGEFPANGYNNTLSHTRGAISMARAEDYNSASSQFFIVQDDSTFLDGNYAAFGYVIEGLDVVDKVCDSAQPLDNNGTIAADAQPVITSITIRE